MQLKKVWPNSSTRFRISRPPPPPVPIDSLWTPLRPSVSSKSQPHETLWPRLLYSATNPLLTMIKLKKLQASEKPEKLHVSDLEEITEKQVRRCLHKTSTSYIQVQTTYLCMIKKIEYKNLDDSNRNRLIESIMLMYIEWKSRIMPTSLQSRPLYLTSWW